MAPATVLPNLVPSAFVMSGSVRPKTVFAEFFARQFDAGGDVAPLIAAADLQFAIVIAIEHVKIKRLQQHVAEFGVADADFAVFHAGADAFLGDHLVDGKMFSDVAQEIEEADVAPSNSALSSRRAGLVFVSKSSRRFKLLFHAARCCGREFPW